MLYTFSPCPIDQVVPRAERKEEKLFKEELDEQKADTTVIYFESFLNLKIQSLFLTVLLLIHIFFLEVQTKPWQTNVERPPAFVP